MLDQIIHRNQMWTTLQEPRTPAYVPNSYLLLLSALDSGWQISNVELASSWDQHGLIYLVTLNKDRNLPQEIILPKNALVASLLDEYFADHSLPQA
jgi:hypothetical protein